MPSFLIDSYKIRLEVLRQGSPVATQRNRIIEIASAMQYHGIVERALLNFSSMWDDWSGAPVVGWYSTSNPYQPLILGWLPSYEYPLWYDVLRAEKPLTLYYEIVNINGADYISLISLGTSTEPIGEGPAEVAERRLAPVLATAKAPVPKN